MKKTNKNEKNWGSGNLMRNTGYLFMNYKFPKTFGCSIANAVSLVGGCDFRVGGEMPSGFMTMVETGKVLLLKNSIQKRLFCDNFFKLCFYGISK